MGTDKIITIEDETFRIIMNKLDRIESIINNSAPVYEKCIKLMQETDLDQIMTLKEVAEYLRFSTKTIERQKKEGLIPCIQFGGAIRFHKREVLNSMYNKNHKNTHKNYNTELIFSRRGNENRK
ncbi:excisionase family DNA binding protein [Dysgonomonas sp. PFB1-18]|uniref:helix-turn-helix transcriptional regulator n=1 Tax=unclassified Dysgonomonas TaxID=2630389 RepID=UPI0024766D73|nr:MULTISPECIES: helix-turn-helix domain-containing protein [unclassified Dysgonomonas]MDH6310888.1 excisionase family DNA binding protein [Dysgonomonas sp. PF1-14]MDH6341043.1 excisionase family DNA binding protein [Dysgonomonas sp. PF1-16]MDH6382726.1 excisionase family DNA binding protein [Dysgonomonas sp. PFB1-18]MDH6400011.1 excisionase family DNA binding protein [Dysgonomonas sp. PF1-23]